MGRADRQEDKVHQVGEAWVIQDDWSKPEHKSNIIISLGKIM